ncbi:MAG: MotA/TolQ/ExbB proton channel family protein [Gallionellaceae bacterium]|nr:MotA/TolQ/ExbB proton channel family protein [Gallionellaceae bacterium]
MNFINAVVRFFTSGGLWMIPIFMAATIGFAIGLERFIKLSTVERANRKLWDQLQPVLSQGNFERAREMTAQDNSTVSQLLQSSLELQGTVQRRENIEVVMEEEMMAIVPQLEKRTSYIALYANLATLLGLLGTVVGLINAFDAVANAAPAEKSNLLSASIAEAMNCTAFGLMVAIPLLIINLFLATKASRIIDSLEIVSLKTLNVISSSARRNRTD